MEVVIKSMDAVWALLAILNISMSQSTATGHQSVSI
jgi:hypothetical protein